MKTKRHRVLLVEDDRLCQDRLARAIEVQAQLTLIASVSSVREAMERLEDDRLNVMVVDIGLPDGSGLDLIRICKRMDASVLCIVVTIYGDEAHVLEALAAGANGYLLKDAPLSDLGEAIIGAIGGGVPISPAIARALLAHLKPPADQMVFDAEIHLSPRETEVLDYLARGYLRAEIAHTLALSINTISVYIKNIYRKLQVNSGRKAIFEARRQGLLREDF